MKKALDAATEFSGLKFEDVSELPEARMLAQLHIEVVANNGDVAENVPCYVRTKSIKNWEFQNVELRMRDDAAYRCNFHEMLHAMSVKGHPLGSKALYLTSNRAVIGALPAKVTTAIALTPF